MRLREKYRLRVLKNRELSRITERYEVIGGWRRLNNQELC
jgi:hypothetical protein